MSTNVRNLLIVGGGVLVVLSLFADQIGIGTHGFGLKQTVGLVVGIAAVLVGGSSLMKGR